MRKLFILSLLIFAAAISVLGQNPTQPQNPGEPPNKGMAPKAPNGVGIADVRIFDESGNPIKNAAVKLESKRTDGYFCYTDWFPTDEQGVVVLPAMHMGQLKLKVKAKGYRSQKLHLMTKLLAEPVRVSLKKS